MYPQHNSLTRKQFLKLGAAGAAGTALLATATPALGATEVSAHTLGIKPANTPRVNRENLIKALTNSNRLVFFPKGDYRIDNSGSYIVIRNFGGRIRMAGGARFIFTDNTTRGLMFERGKGARLFGVRTAFAKRPPKRVGAMECILFIQAEEPVVRNININGSAAAGLLFGRCIRPQVIGATIRNTMADGLHFANCQDARAINITTENTGDDGLAFLNYGGDNPDYTGGYARNVTVRDSRARGIAVVGQRGVLVEDFTVDTTRASGLYCAYEKSYGTRVPRNVVFRDGTVRRGGARGGTPGTNYGINFSWVRSAKAINVEVISPGARGVSCIAPNGEIRLYRVRVKWAPESGFNLQKGKYYLNNLTSLGSLGTGFYAANAGLVKYGTLRAENSSRRDEMHRAFSFERNRRVIGEKLMTVDRKKTPTGYMVNASGPQSGNLGTVYDRVNNRRVRVTNASGINYRGPVR